jgi:hypothetical protein
MSRAEEQVRVPPVGQDVDYIRKSYGMPALGVVADPRAVSRPPSSRYVAP